MLVSVGLSVLGTLLLGLFGVFVGSAAVAGLVGWSPMIGVLLWTPVLLWLVMRLVRVPPDAEDQLARRLRVRRPGAGVGPLRMASASAGVVLLMLVGGSVLAALGIEAGGAASPAEQIADQSFAGWLTVAFTAVLVAPLVEELGFRGFIQRRLEAQLPPAVAIALTALAFGLFHLAASLPLALLAVMLGMVAGVLAWRSDSVLPALVAHAAWNGTLVAADGIARLGIPGGWSVLFGAAVDEPAVNVLFMLLALPLIAYGLRAR